MPLYMSVSGISPLLNLFPSTILLSWKHQNLCCCSVIHLCLTLCDPMNCRMPCFLSFTISWSLPKLMSIESLMPSNHFILYHPLLLLPSIIPSIRVFSSKSALRIRWPNYWSFTFSISPSNEHSGLISFSIDWFDLLVVQGTLKSLLQHQNLKASVPQCSALFMVQLVPWCFAFSGSPVHELSLLPWASTFRRREGFHFHFRSEISQLSLLVIKKGHLSDNMTQAPCSGLLPVEEGIPMVIPFRQCSLG